MQKMQKMQNMQKYQKGKNQRQKMPKQLWSLMMPAFGSEDAKRASQEITKAKVTFEISYDAAFLETMMAKLCQKLPHYTHVRDKRDTE